MDLPLIAATPLRLWVQGPAVASDRVVVSVTDFSVRYRRYAPVVAARGLRLALGWYAMEGSVGLWLWMLPGQWRSGSISIWTAEPHLRRFVGLPTHRAIMRRYRDRGRLRAVTWEAESLDTEEVLARARTWIDEGAEAA